MPSVLEAENLLEEAEGLNPGAWIHHNKTTGKCAKLIASKCSDLDENVAYVLGLLHDIGRRFGTMDMKHIWCGYEFMIEKGYSDSARICLTHSFPYKDIDAYNGENDCTPAQSKCIQNFLESIEYSDYDCLIQLCDAISFPSGATYVEKRLVDVVIRRGFNELTVPKWKAFLALKDYFDTKTNTNIYEFLLP